MMYCAHNPIDDQSNHHAPIASLQATVSNMMGGKTKLDDFMLFRERHEPSIDELLMSGNW